MNAAVSRVQHEPSGSDGPAFARIDEIHVEEVRIGSRRFGEPCAAAIVGCEDLARRAYGPTAIADKTRSIKSNVRAIAHGTCLPVRAAVTRMNDRAACADQTSMRRVSKRAVSRARFATSSAN